MGRGKGDVKEWGAKIRPGRILVELAGVEPIIMKRALTKLSYKLPFATRIIFVKK
jgi:large subunit ribosomal protein L16